MKSKISILTILLAFFLIFSFSCSNDSGSVPVYGIDDYELEKDPWTSLVSTEDEEKIFINRFALDYNYLPAEKDSIAKTYNAADLAGTSSSGSSAQGHIPGLRSLNKYKIKYNDLEQSSQIEDYGMSVAGINQNSSDKKKKDASLKIVDFGPMKFLSSKVANPSIYVLFSSPVIALDRIGLGSSTSDFMTITPTLAGSFKWLGSRHLSFEATEPCDPQQIYTVTINPKIKSLDGALLEGKNSFSFETEEQDFNFVAAGYDEKEKTTLPSYQTSDLPMDKAQNLLVGFKYAMDKVAVEKWLSVLANNVPMSFTVATTDSALNYVIHLQERPKEQSKIEIILKEGAHSSSGVLGTRFEHRKIIRTLNAFEISEVYPQTSYGKFTNPVRVVFSHPVDKKSFLNSIKTSLNVSAKEENVAFYGSVVTIYNLPVEYGEEYTITLDGVKDVYGRPVTGNTSYNIKVPNAASFANFVDSGFTIMEYQFPHKLLVDYQNIPRPGKFYVSKIYNPLSDSYFEKSIQEDDYHEIPSQKENVRTVKEIDLNSVLGSSKKGAVAFFAKVPIRYRYFSYSNNTYEYDDYETENFQVVQITDLGVTVRYGLNKILVWVNSMETGLPVKNAEVHLFPCYHDLKDSEFNYDIYSEFNVSGKTDENGLFEYYWYNNQDEAAQRFLGSFKYELCNYWNGSLVVSVKKDDDSVVFVPDTHSPYKSGVGLYDLYDAFKSKERVLLYTDRGLYKPGETLSFSGIQKNILLGTYLSPKPGITATVTLNSIDWDSEVIDFCELTLGESGSFSGSFVLPDDLAPGTYYLKYHGDYSGSDDYCEYFTVAHFERLKFQTTISVPPVDVIVGDVATANLKASYLSGGYLGGCSYSSNWIVQDYYFNPTTPESKDYVFGVYGNGSRNWISEDDGVLNAQGSASLTCKTSSSSKQGATTAYTVEATVTDVSNQAVSASANVIVHPASFYIGLCQIRNGGGYPSKNETIKYNYMLTDVLGKKLKNKKVLNTSSKFNYKVTRESWVPVQQEGLYGSLYTSYERVEKDVTSGVLPVQTEGSLSFTPNEAGYYKLSISGQDSEGRTAVTETYMYVSGSGTSYWNFGEEGTLNLRPDKTSYVPGEKAQIMLQSPLEKGDYLITVEREGIFTEEVKHFDGNTAVFEIPIAKNYVPVVYVSVCSYSVRKGAPIHEYGTKDFDKPKGYFGVTPVYINPRVKAFSVEAEYDKNIYRPGDEVTLKIKTTRSGNPVPKAELTLMAVDRGVLDLINYHVQDPVKYFYDSSLFPLYVHGGTSYAYLMDPVTYELKNLFGGDSDSKISERKDFNPTAVFKSGIVTDENGEATVKFKLPDTLTTYRMTFVGVKNDVFALQEQELAVQNPINVTEVVPRRMRIRDTAEAGVLITNLDKDTHKVTVNIETKTAPKENDGQFLKGGNAIIDGSSSATVSVPCGASVPVYFDVAALSDGQIELVFTVSSDVLNERIIYPLTIEKSIVKETITSVGQISNEKNKGSAKETIITPSLKNGQTANLSVSLDATQLSTVSDAVNYTFHYPYGCLEQRSSAIFPLVVFGEYIDALGLSSEVKDYKKVIKTEIDYWLTCQLRSGAFPYWPTSTHSSSYVSFRIYRILQIARKKGLYKASDSVINNLKKYLLEEYKELSIGSSWGIEEKLSDLYDLSFGGTLVDNSSNVVAMTKKDDATITAKAFGALALYQAGYKDEAKKIAKDIRTYLQLTARGVDFVESARVYNPWSWSSSKEETLSLLLELYVQLDPADELNRHLMYSLLSLRKADGGYWCNTATTFRIFSAIDTLIKAQNLESTNETANVKFNGESVFDTSFKGLGAKAITKEFDYSQQPLSNLNAKELLELVFEKEGKGFLYYTTSLSYSLPSELQLQRDNGIEVHTRVFDKETSEELTSTQLEAGKLYTMKTSISVTKTSTYVALRVPVPSGCEIVDATFATSARDEGGPGYEGVEDYDYDDYYYHSFYDENSQKIYDNEVQYFWNRIYPGVKYVTFTFRAARRGVYPLPPAMAECMYEPEIFGRTNGNLYTIK